MLFSEKLPSLFALDSLRGDNHVRKARDFFDLEGSDRVVQDVAHVCGVPIEAFDLSHPMLSIYDNRIYYQRDWPCRATPRIKESPGVFERLVVSVEPAA
jgi:hypothetical protein